MTKISDVNYAVAGFLIAMLSIFSYVYVSTYMKGETVDGCEVKTLIPILGRIECEVYKEGAESIREFGPEPTLIRFGDEENSPRAETVSFMCEKADYVIYQLDPNYNPNIPCPIGSDNWCQFEVTPGVWRAFGTDVKLGERFNLYCQEYVGVYPLGWWGEKSKGKVKFVYNQYALIAHESGGKKVLNAKSCKLDDDKIEIKNLCVEGSGKDYATGSFLTCKELKESTRLNFGDWVNYVAFWSEGPSDLNLVDYDGEKAFCSMGRIYSLGKITTKSGCYVYPKDLIDIKDCCPGMMSANAYCGDDFKWHPISTGECKSDEDCPEGYVCQENKCIASGQTCISTAQCPGGGDWIPDYSSSKPTVLKFKCVDRICKVQEKKTVECIPPDRGCPEGKICDPNKGYVCVTPSGPPGYCGDGVCSPYENPIICPEDCKINPVSFNMNLLWIIMPTLMGAVLGYAIKRDTVWLIAGTVFGLAGGLILYYLATLPTIVKILLGLGVIGGVSVILWLFGGAIFTIIMAILLGGKR